MAPAKMHLIVSNTKASPQQEAEQLKLLTSGLVDGLIIQSSCADYQQIAPCIPRDFPMVFIDHPLKNCPYPTLVVSSYTALYQGVEDLIRQGHSQIGYIADQAHIAYSIERLDAYRAAVRDYDLPHRGFADRLCAPSNQNRLFLCPGLNREEMHSNCGLQQWHCAGNLKIFEYPSSAGGNRCGAVGLFRQRLVWIPHGKNRAGIPAHRGNGTDGRPATAGTDSAAKDLCPHHSFTQHLYPEKTGKGVFICLI